jgi:hypothetical protein
MHSPGQGNWEVVGHDGLISSYGEDGRGVDLQKFSGVDRHVLLLWQVGPEFARPYHHSKIWCKRHTPPRAYWRARGSHSTRRGPLSCRRKRFKISLEVAALDVAAPLTVVLNGDTTILTPAAADELIAEVGRRNAQ